MVHIPALWLPILLSAVLVFVASAVIHMMLGYHRSDFKKLPDEDRLLEGLGKENLPPGDYLFPYPANLKDMGSPEMLEKYKRGPVGTMTVLRSGPPTMGKQLLQWFVFCLGVGVAAAYLAGRALGPGEPYLSVFRFAGTAAFYVHSGARIVESIWMGRSWGATLKNVFDGLVYALLTGGVFGWLWPR
jgi:hypothetical protein